MPTQEHTSLSKKEKETHLVAQKLATHLRPGDIVCLCGDLGTGKTTFVKGLAHGLKIRPQDVNSPTFVFMNIYEGKLPLYHFDLYRVEKPGDIFTLDYEEYLYGDGICVIEWAERLGKLLPQEYLKVHFFHKSTKERLLKISAQGDHYEKLLRHWKI